MQIKKFLKSDYFIFILLFCYAFLLSLMSNCSPFTKSSIWGDSAAYMYSGYATANGLTPYVDVYYGQSPFMRLVNCLGWIIGGKAGVWLFELAFMTLGLIFAYKTARMFASKISALISVAAVYSLMASYLQNGNFSEEYALPFLIIGLYLVLKFFKDSTFTRLQLIGIGASCAAAFNFKLNMILLWGVFFVVILIKLIMLKRYRDIFKYLAFALLGFAIVELPVVVYLLAVNALGVYLSSGIFGAFAYASNSSASGSVFASAKYFLLSSLPFFVLSAVYFVFKLIVKRKENGSLWLDYALLANLAITYIGISIIGNAYEHYAMQIIPCFIAPVAWAFAQLEKIVAEYGKKIVITVLALFLIGVCGLNLYEVLNINYEMLTANEYRQVADLIQSYTSKDDKIIVLGYDCNLYLSSDRLAASKYYYQLPGSMFENERTEFVAEIIENRPKFIVLSVKQILEDYPQIYTDLKDFIETNYTEVESSDSYRFYALNA